MRVEKYTPFQKNSWDAFISKSKNGTFLHMRNYMDYHSDRFHDHSLMIYDNENLIAVVPANKQDNILLSHAGLTYGGMVLSKSVYTATVLEIFSALLTYLLQQEITQFLYKTIPTIYHTIPAEEDRYLLFLCQAKLVRRDILSVVNYADRLPIQQRRQRQINKAIALNLTVKQADDYSLFWQILQENLAAKYGTQPIHTLAEILKLAGTFPENIKFYGCYQQAILLAGVVIYETEMTAHAQYISVNEAGRKIGALDLLFHTLINSIYAEKRYFDFGISNENNGRKLNKGLIDQKEGFGARAILHDHYMLDISAVQLNNLRIAIQ
jgi:hypothetical protein